MIGIGIVGYGYWGPNLVRNFTQTEGARVVCEALNRPNNGNTGGRSATYNDFQLPAFLSYEVDAWGRVRHSVEAANATQQATAADLRFVRLAVEANVAMDYYSLHEIDAERQVLDSTVQEMQRADRKSTRLNSSHT